MPLCEKQKVLFSIWNFMRLFAHNLVYMLTDTAATVWTQSDSQAISWLNKVKLHIWINLSCINHVTFCQPHSNITFSVNFSGSVAQLLLTVSTKWQSYWADIMQLIQQNRLEINVKTVKISTKCLYWMNSNIYNRIKNVVLYLLRLVNILSTTLNDLLTIKTRVIVQHSDLISLKCQKLTKQFCL